jgi:ArsR family transcriptional regulator, lead/cadmium/zinc/bismuth-responsive transcriptional repressor
LRWVFKCCLVPHIYNNCTDVRDLYCLRVALNFHIGYSQSVLRCGLPVTSKGDPVIADLLRKINRNLELVARKMDRLIDAQRYGGAPIMHPSIPVPENLPLDVTTLLGLPDHLRKSALALATLGEATATDLSKETGRVRAVESDYLNQLVSMGLVKKKRKGRDVYFYVET